MANFDVSFIYRIIDKYSKPLKRIATNTTGFQNKIGNAGFKMGKGLFGLPSKLDGIGKKLRGLPSLANSAGAAFAVMAASIPVNRAMSFESAVTNLDKKFKFKSLSERSDFIKGLKKMGPELGFNAVQMANLAFEAGKLNIAQEDVQRFVKTAAQTSIALDGLPIEESGQIIGDLKNKFGLAMDGVELFLDSINTLADDTTTNGGAILNIVQRLSGQFKALEIPPELGAGIAAFAAQLEVTPELAASKMRMFMRSLDQAALSAKPLETITGELNKISKMPIAEQAVYIEDAFGKEASSFIMSMAKSTDLFAKTMANVADQTNFAGSRMAEFDRQMATKEMRLAVVRAKFDSLLITIGEKLLPIVGRAADAAGPLLEKMMNFVDQNPGIVKLAAGIGLIVAAAIPLAGIIGTVLLIFNPVGLAIAGVTLAIGLAVAATIRWWDKFKAFGSWVDKVLTAIFGDFWGKVKDVGSTIKSAFNWVIGGGDEATITDQPANFKPPDIIAGQAANQNVALSGNIGIHVDGPGKVREAGMTTTPPANLGFNVAGALSQ